MSGRETVLVTGGSGYIGGWGVAELLRRGYVVRTTIRHLGREAAARAAIASVVDAGDRLTFHAAELTADAGWAEAVAGCDYVLHVASPVSVSEPKDADVLIKPARDGARRVIGAAIKAGVKRVVLTSSVAATSQSGNGDSLSDETVWTNLDDPNVGAYARSKTLAERAAWEMIKSSGGTTTLTSINPSVVLGPVLSKDFSDSVQLEQRLLAGKIPGIPRLGFSIVDVRDLADLHIRAMTAPEAAGQRFIAAGHYAWMADIATLLKARLGSDASKVPTRRLPDFAVRLAGLFDADLRALVPRLGRKREFSSAKARKGLGWQPRALEDTVVDCARSLIAVKAV
jgi:dihydroflavonol-4-reductase